MAEDKTFSIPPAETPEAATPAADTPEAPAYDPSRFPPAAQRALAEAAERKKGEATQAMPKEYGGREGPEPVRFGDWEKKGIAYDF
ncbi:MAG: DUF1674 domain-containing protein [Pseudomonadota bacterium]